MSVEQLVKLDGTVQSMTPHLIDYVQLGFFIFFFFFFIFFIFYFIKKLLEKIQHFVERKFNEMDKVMDGKFNEIKTQIASKLTVLEEKISEHSSHIDNLETKLTQVLNANNTVNACCEASLETAAFVKNTTTKINDMNIRTLNITVKLQEMNETIKHLTDIVVPSIVEHIPKQNDTTESTEPPHNVSDIITTTEVNKPAPSKCDLSQLEKCCTVAVVGDYEYIKYIEMSAGGRHTVVNMTSAGLQEYTVYFAVRGTSVEMLLSSTNPVQDLYYTIGFSNNIGRCNIYMYAVLPSVAKRYIHNIDTTNISPAKKFTHYYLRISGESVVETIITVSYERIDDTNTHPERVRYLVVYVEYTERDPDTLEVGRRGEPPLMKHTKAELRTLRYFSFRGAWCKGGEALYDCPAE